jgi:hypothetical protein
MAKQDIPEVFQEVINLGAPKKVYRTGCFAAGGKIGGAVAIVLILLLMVLFGILGPFLSDDPVSQIPAALFMIGMALLAAYFLWKPFQRVARSLRNTAVLYDGGFAVSAGGEKARVFPWNAIRKVTARITRHTIYGLIPAGTEYKLTISGDDPEPVELDSPLDGVEELHRAIRANAIPRISTDAVAKFHEGQTLEFGPIRANRSQGLLIKDRVLGWNDIRDVQYGAGTLLISPKTGGLFAKYMYEDGAIANIDALLAVCREAGVKVK